MRMAITSSKIWYLSWQVSSFISICLVQIWITFGLWNIAAFKQDLLKTNENNLFLISFSWPWLLCKSVPETGKTEYWSEKKGEKTKDYVCTQAKCLIQQEHIVVSLIWSDLEYYYSSLDGMIVHCRSPPPPPPPPPPQKHFIKLLWQSASTHLYS